MLKYFFNRWSWRMAWLDSRTQRQRLFLFMSSIVLGTAALVAVNSLGESLERAVTTQAKSLLGADLLIESRQPFPTDLQNAIDSISRFGAISRETTFGSMILFPKTGGTRLAQIRSVSGDFPFYGEIETVPQNAYRQLHSGKNAVIDITLADQFDVSVGDSVKIGEITFFISGILKDVPGEAALASVVGPRIYIPPSFIDQTNLIQKGSRVTYRAYFKFPKTTQVQVVLDSIKPILNLTSATSTTAEERQTSLGNTLENLYRFLNLVGFIALLLGSIGVASAVNVYVKQKLQTVAVLRCIGAQSGQTFTIYVIQTLSMGILGATLGAGLGVFISAFLPSLLGDFLPVKVDFLISISAIGTGVAVGVIMAFSFALLPLIAVRHISPLLTLRSAYDSQSAKKDPSRFIIFTLIFLVILIFATLQTSSSNSLFERILQGLYFTLALGISFGILTLIAKLTMFFARRFFPSNWNYVWRQGLANLYRPNNQTLVLILSLGFGTMLISLLYLLQAMLVQQVELTSKDNQPNLVFFDVQSDQQEGIYHLLESLDTPILNTIPIVTMRIASVKGKTIAEARQDSTIKAAWLWEYRVSYRDSLNETETIIDGQLGKPVVQSSDSINISVNEFLAKSLDLSIGDSITFDVQGVPVGCFVGSTRKVDFKRIQPSFSIIFPTGVLEQAPQFYALLIHAKSQSHSTEIQRTIVNDFPNVSAIDLGLILSTVNSILDKVTLVIQFMALFSIITGLTVLAGSVLISRYQRIRESVLLRTLGAVRWQVESIMLVEYFFLGLLAALTGLILSAVGSTIIGITIFNFTFIPNFFPLIVSLFTIVGLTMIIGLFNSRGMHNRSPLEVLRNDT